MSQRGACDPLMPCRQLQLLRERLRSASRSCPARRTNGGRSCKRRRAKRKIDLGSTAGKCYRPRRLYPTRVRQAQGSVMKRAAILLVLVAGCSTAPVADLLDYFRPGAMPAEKTAPHGGICAPRQVGAPVSAPGALPPPCFPTEPGAAAPAAETPSPPPPVFP